MRDLEMSSSFNKNESISSAVKTTSQNCIPYDDLRILRKEQELRSFQHVLHSDPQFMSELNRSVRKRFPSVFEFMATLQSQPVVNKAELIEEMALSNNTLYTPRGVTITKTDQIGRYITLENSERAKQHNLLYQAANKNMLSLLIDSLTADTGLIRPQLSATAAVKDCSWEINLKKDKQPYVVAECFLNISVPGGLCGRLNLLGEIENSRIDVVGVIAEVYFCPGDEALNVQILHLSPSEKMSDHQVLSFANAVVQ